MTLGLVINKHRYINMNEIDDTQLAILILVAATIISFVVVYLTIKVKQHNRKKLYRVAAHETE